MIKVECVEPFNHMEGAALRWKNIAVLCADCSLYLSAAQGQGFHTGFLGVIYH